MSELLLIEQQSAEWFAARVGKVTASRVRDVIAKTKSGYSASREGYMGELIAERLTSTSADRYQNAAMQWGTDKEPEARTAYEFFHETVLQVGFVPHPRIEMTGASPDGYVGASGMLEIKCPNTSTHVDTLLRGVIDGKYVTQMQWQMACAEREWCDYASYDPRLPPSMQLWVQRVHRDDTYIKELETEVSAFLAELAEKVDRLKVRYG